MTTRTLLAALSGLALPLSASAGTLSPWGVHTSRGETWLTPYFFVDGGSVTNATYLSIGLGDRFDLIGGAGVGWSGQVDPGVVEAMPRYFVNENVGLVVRVGSVPGANQLEVGPEIHAAYGSGAFSFTINAGWRPALGQDGGVGGAFAVLAPEVYVSDSVSLYVEVNPAIDLADGSAGATVVPGFSAAVGPHSFAIGAMMPVDDPIGSMVVGSWYSVLLGSAR